MWKSEYLRPWKHKNEQAKAQDNQKMCTKTLHVDLSISLLLPKIYVKFVKPE